MRIGAVQRKRYRNKINLTPKIGAVVGRPLRFFAHGQHEIILHKQRIYIKEAIFKGIAADIQKRRVDTLKTINLCRARVSLCRVH